MILTEKTKSKSSCCNKPVYIEKIGTADGYQSSRPYCSKCLKWPPMSEETVAKMKEFVDSGLTISEWIKK